MPRATGRLGRDASLYFVGKIGAAIGVVVAIPLVTRGLVANDFADFALWSAVTLWSTTACVGWLSTGIGRLHRERRGTARFAGYLASVRAATGIGAAASAVLVIALAAAFSRLSVASILAFAAMAAATALFMGRQALAQADLEAWRVVKGDLVRGAVLPLLLGLATLVCGLGVALAALAHALALLVSVALLPMPRGAPGMPDWSELRPLARYGAPIGLWSVICLGSAQLGRAALELAGDPAALALYAGLQEVIVKGGTLLLMPVVSALHAHTMAWWAQGDHASIAAGLRRGFVMQAVIGGVMVLGTLAMTPLLTRILFAEAAPPGGTALSAAVLLAVGVVAANMGLLAHKRLELAHATGTMVICACGALLLNALVCGLLVPRWGASGAALGFAGAQVFYVVGALVCGRRRAPLAGS